MSTENNLLLISPNQSTNYLVRARFSNLNFTLRSITGLNELLSLEKDFLPNVCLVEANKGDKPEMVLELVSLVRSLSSDIQCFVIHRQVDDLPATNLYQLGVKGIFNYPFEEELLINALFSSVDVEIDSGFLSLDVMMKINVPEVKAAKTLPFDVYLFFAKNEKFILYRKKNSELNAQLLDRLENENKEIFYIRRTEIREFQRYMGEHLSNIKNDPKLGKTEKVRRLKNEVCGIMSGFFTSKDFNEAESKAFLDSTNKIITEFIGKSTNQSLYERIQSLTSQTYTNYSHCANTSTYCTMFGLLAELENLQDLSLGGLLHDIGLAELPTEISQKDAELLNWDEFKLYKNHPLFSVDVIKRKKIPVSQNVIEMIEQHHELPNGFGYPKQLKSGQINVYAKVLAMADHFDEITSLKMGAQALSPRQALMLIAGLIPGIEAAPYFEKQIHGKIVEALLGDIKQEELSAEIKIHAPSVKHSFVNLSLQHDMATGTTSQSSANSDIEDSFKHLNRNSSSGSFNKEKTKNIKIEELPKDLHQAKDPRKMFDEDIVDRGFMKKPKSTETDAPKANMFSKNKFTNKEESKTEISKKDIESLAGKVLIKEKDPDARLNESVHSNKVEFNPDLNKNDEENFVDELLSKVSEAEVTNTSKTTLFKKKSEPTSAETADLKSENKKSFSAKFAKSDSNTNFLANDKKDNLKANESELTIKTESTKKSFGVTKIADTEEKNMNKEESLKSSVAAKAKSNEKNDLFAATTNNKDQARNFFRKKTGS